MTTPRRFILIGAPAPHSSWQFHLYPYKYTESCLVNYFTKKYVDYLIKKKKIAIIKAPRPPADLIYSDRISIPDIKQYTYIILMCTSSIYKVHKCYIKFNFILIIKNW